MKGRSCLITEGFAVQTHVFRDVKRIKHSNVTYFGGFGQHNPQATLNSDVLTSQKAAAGTGNHPTKGEEILGCLVQ